MTELEEQGQTTSTNDQLKLCNVDDRCIKDNFFINKNLSPLEQQSAFEFRKCKHRVLMQSALEVSRMYLWSRLPAA